MAYRLRDGAGPDEWDGPSAQVYPSIRQRSAIKTPPRLGPELDCIRHRLSPDAARVAEQRADEFGFAADRILVAWGALDEDEYLEELAASLGTVFEPLDAMPREACPLSDERMLEAAAVGILPIRLRSDLIYVVAPRGIATRRLTLLLRQHPKERERFRFTTTARLNRFVTRHAAERVGFEAAQSLAVARPDLSAARGRPWPLPAILLLAAAFASIVVVLPGIVQASIGLALAIPFLAWTTLRLWCAAAPRARPWPTILAADRDLPIVTVMVALYREQAAVGDLLAALLSMDYPREKLDIKLVLERDDYETRLAVSRLQPPPCVEVMLVPDIGPRTKPKALNAALAFSRGEFIAVYDAEDRPERDQLRRAVDAFRASGQEVACVQACLTIDNTNDNWLTGFFTAEYAGLFDVVLPALARISAPLPLGGSSNHFRASVLRKIGAWDPYNVTEDADLGMRLHRFGYRTVVISSTTYEEAPARLRPWLKQRTRWFKGWMQTWLVHMRSPRTLLDDLGLMGFVVFQLAVGGTVLSALVHLCFVAAIAYAFATGNPLFGHGGGSFGFAVTALFAATLVAGYVASVVLGTIGLARRRLLSAAWVMLFAPLHWLLLSVAAWRALFQLLRDPYRWEKTEHGLARTSRRAHQRKPGDPWGRPVATHA